MMNSRTMLQRMKQTALLTVFAAAAWSCETPEESRAPAELSGECPDGSELVSQAPEGGTGRESCQLAIGIAECPSEAQLADDGLRQRCQRDVGVRHGASSGWYENGRNRVYTEWWDGAKHGKFTLWYDNGQVRSEGFHAHGKPAGEWVYYAEDGSVLQRRTFPALPPAATWLADAIAGRPPVETK